MLLKVAFKNLLRHPRRSLAILLTVALGTGALFLYHGFNTGIMNQYKYNTIRSRYGHGQINTQGYRDKVYEKPWEHWIDNYHEIRSFLDDQKEIAFLFPRVEFFAMLTNEKITVTGKGQGIKGKNESEFFQALNIIEGKNLSQEEDGVILGKGLARALDVKIGDRVTVLANTIYGSLNGIDLYVTGIFHTGTKEFDDVVFRLPLNQAHTLLDTNKIESIALGLYNDEDWSKVASKVKEKFPHLEITPFAVLDEVYYQHAVDFLKKQFDTIKIIILVIVIMGIFNTVATSVLERRQEIGNLRANGESKFDILLLLSFEGLWLGLIGSIFGILIALFTNNTFLMNGILMPPSPGITRQFHVFIELQPDYAFICLLLGPATALFGSLLAGMKISKETIAELLRAH